MSARDRLAGTGTLLRLALRRDRIMAPAWVFFLAVAVTGTAASFSALYSSAAQRAELAAGMATNSSLRAFYGPVYDSGIGGLTAWRMGSFGAALTGLMALLLVVRHTREEEEAGRLELVGAGAVGRYAPLAAGLITACGASGVLALLITAGMAAYGLTGAVALGLAFGGAGCVFAGVAAVAAQLAGTARAARGIAGAVLGLSFLLRAAGDAAAPGGARWPAWISPLGWSERLRPYADTRWWLVAAFAVACAALVAVAYALVDRRDLGAGLLAVRRGPRTAGRTLAGSYGLAWRLQRGSLVGWTAAMAVSGAAFGGMTNGVADLFRGNPQIARALQDMGGTRALADAFLAAMIGMLGMVTAIQAVQAVLRLRAEETAGRAETVLATAVGRSRWAAGHLLIAFAGPAVLLLAGGAAMGLAYGASIGDPGGQLPRLAGAALVQLPAVWLLAALATLLCGAVPRLATAGWGLVSLTLAIGVYGPVLRLGHWVLDLSAFTHLPKVPSAAVTLTPLVWLTALAAAALAAALAALRRRDVG